MMTGWMPASGLATAQSGAPASGVSDDSLRTGDVLLLADSLSARFAGQDDEQTGAPPARGIDGRLQFSWTPMPLKHHGPNIFQALQDDPRLLTSIRQLKRDGAWDPYKPGILGRTPYDYGYGADGNERRSLYGQFLLERPLPPEEGWGFRFESRYDDLRGPFPNQRTARLDGLLRLSHRFTPSHTLSVGLLGIDAGWHLNRGNRVFTDRARYMLEYLNAWRARSAGVEAVFTGNVSSGTAYTLFGRYVSHDWASDPPAPSRMVFPAPGDTLPTERPVPEGTRREDRQYINGLYPVVTTSVSAAQRAIRSFEAGGEAAFDLAAWNRLTLGAEARWHRLSQMQHWQTLSLLDRYRVAIHPKAYAVYVADRFRFWTVVMALGLRYDAYRPGTPGWGEVYRTHLDGRTGLETIRQALLSSGLAVGPTHLLNPHFSVSYPTERMTVHLTFSMFSRSLSLEEIHTERVSTPYADRAVTHLLPRRTYTLESGVSFSRNAMTIDLTAFYRDAEYYAPRFGPDVLPQALSNYADYWGRVNRGFQSQPGIEATVTRRPARLGKAGIRVSGRFSYLYLFDTGRLHRRDLPPAPGDPVTPADLTTFDPEINDFWNRRHWAALSAAFRFPAGLTLTTVGHVQSGVPYRGLDGAAIGTFIPRGHQAPTRYGPWMRRIDGRVDWPVRFGGRSPVLVLFLEGRNITNERIINLVADPAAFEQNGLPDHPTIPQTQWVYGPARSLWTGFELRW
jgi:hypothetical protein